MEKERDDIVKDMEKNNAQLGAKQNEFWEMQSQIEKQDDKYEKIVHELSEDIISLKDELLNKNKVVEQLIHAMAKKGEKNQSLY